MPNVPNGLDGLSRGDRWCGGCRSSRGQDAYASSAARTHVIKEAWGPVGGFAVGLLISVWAGPGAVSATILVVVLALGGVAIQEFGSAD